MDRGHFDEACPKLEESLRLDHGIGTQFNLAHCWEKIGRTASAWGLFLDVASAAATAQQPKREAAARERAAALEPQLIRLSVEVSEPTAGLTVRRSGEEVGRGAWGTAMPIDPGTYRIEASAPGKLPWASEIEARLPGKALSVVIPALEDEAVAPAEPVVVEAEQGTGALPDGAAPGMSTGRIVTSTLLAVVGVAGVVTGTLYGLDANAETAEARKLCVGGPQGNICDRGSDQPGFDLGAAEQSELEEHRRLAERSALISYVGWGVGAAGLVASAVVLLTTPGGAEPAESAGLRLEPSVAPGWIGTHLSGSF